jgi:spore maturation protein CgeB
MDKDVFTNDEIVFAKTPEEFEELVLHYLKYPDERLPFIKRGYETVCDKHTYFDRCADIFNNLHLSWEADKVMEVKKEILSTIDSQSPQANEIYLRKKL